MKNLAPLSFILLLVAFTACKKEEIIESEEADPVPEELVNGFQPLTIGSYWVYEFYTKQPNGTISNQTIDTLKIIGDTIVNNMDYKVFSTNKPQQNSLWFRRNDNGQILSQYNSIITPFDNKLTTIQNAHYGFLGGDTTYYYWEEFSGFVNLNTSFGELSCIQMTAYHQNWPNFGGILTADTNYFSSIGMIQRSYAFTSGIRLIGELVSYHLE